MRPNERLIETTELQLEEGLTLGAWLKRRRKQLELTQERLAERVGYSVDAIRKIESGAMRPSRQLAELLALSLLVAPTDRPAFVQWARSAGHSKALVFDGPALPKHRPRTNVPIPPTPLVGREQELVTLHDMLLNQEVRLVTLTGPGGTGKTRLASQAALDVLECADRGIGPAFRDGVFFVSLASINDAALVGTTVAKVLDVRERQGQTVLDALKDYLHDKDMLLLLDNFEHLAAAAPLVSELLGTSAHLRVLTTSRSPLHVRGEREFPVAPLEIPDPKLEPLLEQLTHYDSVRLFAARARDVKPDFGVTSENARAVAEICRRLDGLPLAIELAAARAKLLPPQLLLARLEGDAKQTGSSLQLLTGGPRDLPARQRTLRDTIAWSHDLLNEAEQSLFRRLAVFMGGWTLEAAEEVAALKVEGTQPPNLQPSNLQPSTLDSMASLLDKSLLRVHDGEDGQRFDMLETIREYALERLEESGERERLHKRHAEYFLVLAEQAEPKLRGREQIEWLNRLDEEHSNLRAALTWAEATGHLEASLRLGAALLPFWSARGYLYEGRAWLTRLLDQAGETVRPSVRAPALGAVGALASMQGDYAEAQPLLEASLALYREVGDKAGMAQVLHGLSNQSLIHQWDFASARALAEEGLALAQAAGDRRILGALLYHLGLIAAYQGDEATERQHFAEALSLLRETGDKRLTASLLRVMGASAIGSGEYVSAGQLIEESLDLHRGLGDKTGITRCLANLAEIYRHLGDYAMARWFSEQSLPLARELGDKWWISASLGELAVVASAQGRYDEAEARLRERTRVWGETPDTMQAHWDLLDRAKVARAQGDVAAARIMLTESLRLLEQGGATLMHKPTAAAHLGLVASDQGNYAEARALLDESLADSRAVNLKLNASQALQWLGRVAREEGNLPEARALFRQSLTLYKQMGTRGHMIEVLEEVAALAVVEGRLTLAARLYAAAAAARDTLGAPMSVADDLIHVRYQAAILAVADEAQADAARTEGQAMTLEQAIAYALETSSADG